MRNRLLVSILVLGLALGGTAYAKDKDTGGGGGGGGKSDEKDTGGGGGGGGKSDEKDVVALAAVPTLDSRACALTDISGPNASACSGWFEGNLNGGSSEKLDEQAFGLNQLVPGDPYTGATLINLGKMDGPGGDPGDNGVFSSNGLGGFTINFNQLLFGETIVSFHVGAASGQPTGIGYNATAFFLFDAGVAGLDTFTLNVAGLSNAILYSTQGPGIPEPTTWALMIIGFGGAGAMLRRRRERFA